MEISNFLYPDQQVEIEYILGGAKGACKGVVKMVKEDSLYLEIERGHEPRLDNGDAVIVKGKSGSLSFEFNARALGGIKGSELNLKVTGKKEWLDTREDVRVYDTLPFDYVTVSREEYERYKSSYMTGAWDDFLADPWQREEAGEVEGHDLSLHRRLVDLDHKLNLIILHLSLQNKGQTIIPELREVNISASGLRFDAEKELAIGDIIKSRLILPTYPFMYLTLLSEVVRINKLENGKYETGVRFLDLSNKVRDKIVSYLFKRQRETIRKGRG